MSQTNSDDRHIHIRLRLVSSSLHHTTTVLYTENSLLTFHPNPFSLPLAFILLKPQTNTIHTMSLISRSRISLSLEHMSQMSPTVATHNLRALHSK